MFDLNVKAMDPVISYDSADAKFSVVSFAPHADVVIVRAIHVF